MIIDQNIANLISILETKIANHCYNPKSYNGYTGEEGYEFRYPVFISKKNDNGTITEEKCWGTTKLNPDNVRTLKYKFGSNHLMIGDGLIDLLSYLEERYELDFSKLEQEKHKHV